MKPFAHQAASLSVESSTNVVHELVRSRIDQLFLGLTDYASLVEAVGLYEHQSRRGSVFDRKDQFDIPFPLHG